MFHFCLKGMTIDFTPKVLWQVLGALVVLVVLYAIRDVLVLIFIALILAAVLEPAVQYFVTKNVPKGLAILLWYFIVIGLITFIFAVVVPPVTRQIAELARDFPFEYTTTRYGWNGPASAVVAPTTDLLEQFTSFLRHWRDAAGSRGGNLITTVFGIFGGFVSFVSVLVMAFYMLLERDGLRKFVKAIVPVNFQEPALSLLQRMQYKMGLWVRGEFILMVSVGLLSYIALLILGVRYALVLALLAGLLEIVPIIGPITAAIPAVVIAFAESPLRAVTVLVMYVVIQQLENHVLIPRVMSKSIGLSPLLVIIAILVGAKLGGIVGTLLAVPAITALSVLWQPAEPKIVV